METIIEILIDESGSMGYMKGNPEYENKCLIDGETRMTVIKKLMINEIIPTLDYASQIIIRTFRNNSKKIGSQTTDEIVTPIIYQDIFNKPKIIAVIAALKDPLSGGTPITAAINAAIADLKKYPNSDRKILLITDGEENGGGNYVEAAQNALKLDGIPCKIFIVGLNQDESSSKKSKEIATGGYCNITSVSFTADEVKKVIGPLKAVILENSIQNLRSASNIATEAKISEVDQPVNNKSNPDSNILESYLSEIRLLVQNQQLNLESQNNKYFDVLKRLYDQNQSNLKEEILDLKTSSYQQIKDNIQPQINLLEALISTFTDNHKEAKATLQDLREDLQLTIKKANDKNYELQILSDKLDFIVESNMRILKRMKITRFIQIIGFGITTFLLVYLCIN